MGTIYENEDPQFSPETLEKIEDLYRIDAGIENIRSIARGSNSIIYIYTSLHDQKKYIYRVSFDVKLCEEEFDIHKRLAKADIAPKIYYGAKKKSKLYDGPEYISIMEKGENLLKKMDDLNLPTVYDKNKDIIIDLFSQCLILIYRMIYEHEIYCADQKINNFVYFNDGGNMKVKMIDFGMDWCKLENIIEDKDKDYKDEFLSDKEKFKFNYLILLWIQTIISYYFNSPLKKIINIKEHIKKISKTIIKTSIERIKNINITNQTESPFKEYEDKENPYQEIVCNKDLLYFLRQSKKVIETFKHYIPVGDTIEFDESYLDCLPPLYTPSGEQLLPPSSISPNKQPSFPPSSGYPRFNIRRINPRVKLGGLINKKQNKKSKSKKQNKKSKSKKLNKKSNKKSKSKKSKSLKKK